MFICYFLYILIKSLRNRKLNIEKMSDKVFYLVYGIPGSGKSTYVEKQIKNKFKQLQHFEADMFFYLNESHTYNFDFKRLGSAHSWCKKHFVDAINQELPVCISNTSLTVKERNFYLKKAKEYKAALNELESVEIALIAKDITTYSSDVEIKSERKVSLEDEFDLDLDYDIKN